MKTKLFIAILQIVSASYSQTQKPDNWQTLDPSADHIYGVGIEEAYKTLKDRTPKQIIVAVIDGGVDPNHEDLKDIIWTNPGEIPDNGIDDDHNGYIDDVHGWNFIGGKNGEIDKESTELTRLYMKMNKRFSKADTTKLAGDDAKDYAYYKKIKQEYLKEKNNTDQQLKGLRVFSSFADKVKANNNGVFDKDGVAKYNPDNEQDKKLKKNMKLFFAFGLKPEELESQLKEAKEQLANEEMMNTMNADSIRQYIVGDDVYNVNERYYGNNHIQGPDALHGSHVSGIIAAIRNNSKGINGIANNVRIMVIRAVPDGDERDKDIANSIRYAVDNGAKVINMSFGKYYSPDKKAVDDAIKYAQSKDVLLIHGSGNESKNSDMEPTFPNNELLSGEMANNWINVGANSYKGEKTMIASFSNYGQRTVDLFAPGVDIYSTIPDNKYTSESGTSMSSPCVAGVAAVIREYFPELKANEVKDVLMKTVTPYKKKLKVPGTKRQKKKMSKLCVSGGFVNANNAVKELMGLNKKK